MFFQGITGNDITLAFGVFFVTWLITTVVTNGYRVSLLDDLGSLNIVVGLSLGMIFLLSKKEVFPERGIIEVVTLVGFFYFGILLFSAVTDTKKYREVMSRRIFEVASEDQAYEFVLSAFFLFLVTSLVFFVLQLGASSPDERNIFASKFRVLDILRTGSSTIVGYIFLIRLLALAEKRMKWLVGSFIGVSLLSGSKSALLGFLHVFLTARGIVMGKAKVISEIRFLAIWGSLALVFGVGVVFFYIGDLGQATQQLVYRLFLSGDVYLFSYVTADYRELIGEYNPVTYVLHPFLRLLGLKGYDYPIGCRLMELVTGESEFGPNPHLPIVALIFTAGNLFFASIAALGVGALVVGIKRFLIDVLSWKQLPPVWRLSIFFACFETGSIFIDFQLYTQRIISVFAVVVLLSIFHELRRGKYYFART